MVECVLLDGSCGPVDCLVGWCGGDDEVCCCWVLWGCFAVTRHRVCGASGDLCDEALCRGVERGCGVVCGVVCDEGFVCEVGLEVVCVVDVCGYRVCVGDGGRCGVGYGCFEVLWGEGYRCLVCFARCFERHGDGEAGDFAREYVCFCEGCFDVELSEVCSWCDFCLVVGVGGEGFVEAEQCCVGVDWDVVDAGCFDACCDVEAGVLVVDDGEWFEVCGAVSEDCDVALGWEDAERGDSSVLFGVFVACGVGLFAAC